MRITACTICDDKNTLEIKARELKNGCTDFSVSKNQADPELTEVSEAEESVWAFASRCQLLADGIRGCGGDIRPYVSLIQEMMSR